MADKQTKGLVINIEANTSTISRQINSLKQEFKKFEKDINNISKAFDIDGTPLVSYSTKLLAMQSSASEAEKVVNQLSLAMKAMENEGISDDNLHSYALLAQKLSESKKQAEEATTRLNELTSGISAASEYAKEFANNFAQANRQIEEVNTAFKFDPSTVETSAVKMQLLQTSAQSARDSLEMLREEMQLRLAEGASLANPVITELASKIGLMQKNVDDSKLSLDNYVMELANVATGFSQAREHADAFANRFTTLENTVRNLDTALEIDPRNLDLIAAKMDLMDAAVDAARGKVEQLSEALQAKLSQGLDYTNPEVAELAAELAKAKEALETANAAAIVYSNSLSPVREEMMQTAQGAETYSTSISAFSTSYKTLGTTSKQLTINLQNSRSAIKTTETAMYSLAKAMVLNPRGFEDTTELLKLLEKESDETRLYIEELNQAIEEKQNSNYANTAEEVAELKLKLAEAEQSIQRLNELQQNLNGTNAEAQQAVRTLANENLNLSSSTNEVSESFDKSLTSINSWTVALGNLAAMAIRRGATELRKLTSEVYSTGSEFDNTSNSLKAMYGNVSDSEFNSLEDKFRSLGLISEHSATEINNASQALALAGYNVEQTSNAIKPIIQLAEGMGEEFSTMSDIVVDGLAEFDMKSSQATHFSDVLAKAALSTNTNVTDLGEAMQYAGSVAGSFRYSIEDVAQALGTMATQGVKGSQAGTALRTMLTRISANVSKANDVLEKLGVHFFDSKGRANDLSETLSKLRDVMKGMSTQEQAQLAYTVTGTRGLTALTAIVNTSAEDWENLGNKIANASGTVEQVANERLDNLYGDAQKLNNTFEDLSITLYQSVSPSLRESAQTLTSFLQTKEANLFVKRFGKQIGSIFDGLTKTLKALAPHLNEVSAGFTAIGRTMISMVVANKAKSSFDKITSGALALKAVFDELNSGTLTLTTAFGGAGIAISGLIVLYSALKGAVEIAKAKWEDEHPQIMALRDAYDELNESIGSTKESLLESAQSSYESLTSSQLLIDELDSLVDTNGKVKDGMEDRVKYILSELSNAYGIEYNLVDGVIDKYDELTSSIHKSVEEQTKSKFVGNLNEQLTEVYQQLAEAKSNISVASKEVNEELSKYFGDDATIEITAGKAGDMISAYWDGLKAAYGVGFEEFSNMALEDQEAFVQEHAQIFDGMFGTSLSSAQTELTKVTDSLASAYSVMRNIEESIDLANSGDLEGAIQKFYEFSNGIEESALTTEDKITSLWTEYDALLKAMVDPENAGVADLLKQAKDEVINQITELQGYTADPNNRVVIHTDLETSTNEAAEVAHAIGYQIDESLAGVNQNIADSGTSTVNTWKQNILSPLSEIGIDPDLVGAAQSSGTQIITPFTDSATEEINRGFTEDIVPETYQDSNLTVNAAKEIINFDSGKQITSYWLDGLIAGLKDQEKLAAVKSAADSVGKAIDSATRGSMWINSPSKLAKEIGMFWDDGLIIGLKAKMDAVGDMAKNVSKSVIDNMIYGSNAVSGLFGGGSSHQITQNLTFNGNYSKRDGLSVARDLDRLLGGAI